MERFIEKHGNKLAVVFGLIFVMSVIIGLAGCGQGSTSVPKGEVLMLDRNTSYVVENPGTVAHNDNSVVVLGGENTVVTQSDECGDGGTLADGICIITSYSSSSSSSSSSIECGEGNVLADGICVNYTVSSSSSSSSSEAICGDGYIFADGVCVLDSNNAWPTTYDECVVKGWGWIQWTDENGTADGACVLDIGPNN